MILSIPATVTRLLAERTPQTLFPPPRGQQHFWRNSLEELTGRIDLQSCGAGRKSRRRVTLVVGKKPNGKSRLTQYMKTRNPVIISFIAGMCALAFLPQFAGAQPSGTIVTNVSSATNLVWDCSAGLTNIVADVKFKRDVGVTVSYPVSVSQSGSGAI